MSGTTTAQSLRYGQVTDVVTHAMVANLADDIATQLNAADTARTTALQRPVVRARRVLSALNLPVSTIVFVPFDQEIYDTHAMFDTAVNPTRVTCTSAGGAGVYGFNLVATCITTSWNKGEYLFYKNGTFVCQVTALGPESSAPHGFAFQVDLAVNDYVECAIYHEGGGTTTTLSVDLRGYKVSA